MSAPRRSERFPLWKHKGTGQWCRKRGPTFYYFGPDKAEAHKRYLAEWPDILAGKAPTRTPDALTVRQLVNEFLTAKRQRVDSGELTAAVWGEYHAVGGRLVELFEDRAVCDLRPADFGRLRASVARKFKPSTLAKFITVVKTIFGFAYKGELIPTPVRYGNQFDKPSAHAMRMRRAERGPLLVEPSAIWQLLAAADPVMRAVILLGLNAAYGQKDCGDLQRKALTIRPGWLIEPRRKTFIGRTARLWPETEAALADVAKVRPEPADPADAGCVFLTVTGQRLVRFRDCGDERRGVNHDAAARMFAKLVRKAGVTWPGGLYTCRHIFRTIADETKDVAAVDLVMGHKDLSMGGHYREKIDDSRIEAVTAHVRQWLLSGKPGEVEAPAVLPFTAAG